LHLGRHELGLEEAAVGREWLLTNGLGGFASSTVGGLNTRRYHGWLVAQVNRYGGRFVVLSKFEEELRLDGETYRLTTNRFKGGHGGPGGVGGGGGPGPIITPRGYRYLQGFDLAPLPLFSYYLRGFFLERPGREPHRGHLPLQEPPAGPPKPAPQAARDLPLLPPPHAGQRLALPHRGGEKRRRPGR